jgi:hypothetical protein
MKKFDLKFNELLNEFNIQNRNDPDYYDYVVLVLQQLKQRGLIGTKHPIDIRKTATETIKKGFFNYIDTEADISYKLEFIFNTSSSGDVKMDTDTNNLTVRIVDLQNPEQVQIIENTHDEYSVKEIGEFLSKKKIEKQAGGGVEPTEVGETPSALPTNNNSAQPPLAPTGGPNPVTSQQAGMPAPSDYMPR